MMIWRVEFEMCTHTYYMFNTYNTYNIILENIHECMYVVRWCVLCTLLVRVDVFLSIVQPRHDF